MKAIVYSIRKNEKEILQNANGGKHEFTWTKVPLSLNTVTYAAGHQAVLVFTRDEVSCSVIAKLAALGVKFILTRSAGTDQIDFAAAAKHQIQVANIPDYSPYSVAEHTLALTLALCRNLVEAHQNCLAYDFTLDHLTGFNLHGKKVGIIGLGHIGKTTAKIFQGFGCEVTGFDTDPMAGDAQVRRVELDELLKNSDIISLHVPLNDSTKHMINSDTISSMKNGVMLINTARGGLVNTADLLEALDERKLGYYGADVYEFEQGMFFEDHEADGVRDPLLTRLMEHRNVLLTPHQAFLTVEALNEIATHTIQQLDSWGKITEEVVIQNGMS